MYNKKVVIRDGNRQTARFKTGSCVCIHIHISYVCIHTFIYKKYDYICREGVYQHWHEKRLLAGEIHTRYGVHMYLCTCTYINIMFVCGDSVCCTGYSC